MKHLVLALLVSACTAAAQAPGPDVHLIGDVTPGVLAGAAQWERVGFSVTEADALPECSPTWYTDGNLDCVITITVSVRDAHGAGGWANLRTREAVIDPSMLADAYLLQSIAAHEVGHIVLDTGTHLDFRAVMNLSRVAAALTPSDEILACSAVGLCVDGLTPNPSVHIHDDGATR